MTDNESGERAQRNTDESHKAATDKVVEIIVIVVISVIFLAVVNVVCNGRTRSYQPNDIRTHTVTAECELSLPPEAAAIPSRNDSSVDLQELSGPEAQVALEVQPTPSRRLPNNEFMGSTVTEPQLAIAVPSQHR